MEPIGSRMGWLDLLAVRGTLKSLLQHHSSKASILQPSAFFMVQFSHPYMTTGKTIALIIMTVEGPNLYPTRWKRKFMMWKLLSSWGTPCWLIPGLWDWKGCLVGNQVINLVPPYICIHAKGICTDLVAFVWLVLKENYPSRKVRMMVIKKCTLQGLPCWSSGKISMLPIQGAEVWSMSGN